jgi:hypothetical protein
MCQENQEDPISGVEYIEIRNREGRSFFWENRLYNKDILMMANTTKDRDYPIWTNITLKQYNSIFTDSINGQERTFISLFGGLSKHIDYNNGDLDTIYIKDQDNNPVSWPSSHHKASGNIYHYYFNDKLVRTFDFQNYPDSAFIVFSGNDRAQSRRLWEQSFPIIIYKDIDYDEIDPDLLD